MEAHGSRVRVSCCQEPSYDDVFKLDYMQQVIDETLRIYAPAPRSPYVTSILLLFCILHT